MEIGFGLIAAIGPRVRITAYDAWEEAAILSFRKYGLLIRAKAEWTISLSAMLWSIRELLATDPRHREDNPTLEQCSTQRQVGGTLIDNLVLGRRRDVWINKPDNLIENAQRELALLGMELLFIALFSRLRPGSLIRLAKGVLFITYATPCADPRGGKISRVGKIVKCLDFDLDGVIVFDESYAIQIASPDVRSMTADAAFTVIDRPSVLEFAEGLQLRRAGVMDDAKRIERSWFNDTMPDDDLFHEISSYKPRISIAANATGAGEASKEFARNQLELGAERKAE
ncbi:strawberry notch-like NTP hydrolase domain-containing protein [Bradyrhizobium sp. BR 1432]|uniref:strawberry notch-like NTP hydrolase domain-containing protein n=1 Tax=Bradyrhizobium sp. BR 1432 TaxID=3447966 RepID=UPI003EE6FD55